MTATASTRTEVDTPAEVLGAVRAAKVAENLEAARKLQLAVDWAAMHSVDSMEAAATLWAPRLGFEEEAAPVAGPGAPLVAEFCVAEFAAAVGMPTEVGRLFLGEALELRYRFLVSGSGFAGDLPAWRARRIARATICLSAEAAAPRGPARRAGGAQDRAGADRAAGGGGDRPVHARDRGRGDPASGRGRAALHRRPRPGLLCRHLADRMGRWTWPTPWTWTRRSASARTT